MPTPNTPELFIVPAATQIPVPVDRRGWLAENAIAQRTPTLTERRAIGGGGSGSVEGGAQMTASNLVPPGFESYRDSEGRERIRPARPISPFGTPVPTEDDPFTVPDQGRPHGPVFPDPTMRAISPTNYLLMSDERDGNLLHRIVAECNGEDSGISIEMRSHAYPVQRGVSSFVLVAMFSASTMVEYATTTLDDLRVDPMGIGFRYKWEYMNIPRSRNARLICPIPVALNSIDEGKMIRDIKVFTRRAAKIIALLATRDVTADDLRHVRYTFSDAA